LKTTKEFTMKKNVSITKDGFVSIIQCMNWVEGVLEKGKLIPCNYSNLDVNLWWSKEKKSYEIELNWEEEING
jgi:hypothetical protein